MYIVQKTVKTVMLSLIECLSHTQRVFMVVDLTIVDFLICIAYSCASRIILIVIYDVTVYNTYTIFDFYFTNLHYSA